LDSDQKGTSGVCKPCSLPVVFLQCSVEGCPFVAAPKLVALHYNLVSGVVDAVISHCFMEVTNKLETIKVIF